MSSEMWSGNWKLQITSLVNLLPSSLWEPDPSGTATGRGQPISDMTSNRKFKLLQIACIKRCHLVPYQEYEFGWMVRTGARSSERVRKFFLTKRSKVLPLRTNLVPTSMTCCFTIFSVVGPWAMGMICCQHLKVKQKNMYIWQIMIFSCASDIRETSRVFAAFWQTAFTALQPKGPGLLLLSMVQIKSKLYTSQDLVTILNTRASNRWNLKLYNFSKCCTSFMWCISCKSRTFAVVSLMQMSTWV